MKKIVCPLFVLMVALFASSHVSAQTQHLPPMRTADPSPVVHPVAPALPMKGGAPAGSKFVPPASRLAGQQSVAGSKATAMPIKQGAAGTPVTNGLKNATPAP